MRHAICSGLLAAALGTTCVVASAIPASTQVARPLSGLAADGSDQGELLTLVRGGGGGGGGGGGAGCSTTGGGGGAGGAT